VLELPVRYDWLATRDIHHADALVDYDAIWVVPASPYENAEGAFTAIRYARKQRAFPRNLRWFSARDNRICA
jgi:CTP synthase (UTP-ammonia lyase)